MQTKSTNSELKKEYNSEIYYAVKTSLCFLLGFAIGFAVLLFIAVRLKSDVLMIFGSICLFISPIIFQKSIRRIFTNRAFLEFDEKSFTVTEFSIKENVVLNKSIFNWSDIKSYKVYFTTRNLTNLTIYLKDGSNKTFGFKDDKTFEQAIKEESIFSIFHSYIKEFNESKEINEKISLAPPFLVTRLGGTILFGTVGLSIFAVCFHMYEAPKSSPFTLLMGVSIIIGLLGKRKQDKDAYTRISSLG